MNGSSSVTESRFIAIVTGPQMTRRQTAPLKENTMQLSRLLAGFVCALGLALAAASVAAQQQSPPQFGGGYAGLDEHRQRLVNDWVRRLVKTTGQNVEPGAFYDEIVGESVRTTFEAVTHALQRIQLTDTSGGTLGDALALVAQVEYLRGEVVGARGDRQFRMYALLTPEAPATLARSQQFKRGADNLIYHKGYPTNYREQGGNPSVQISITRDGRRADIDVDYRASSFPTALFNGHLTAANSDVRAGDNVDRHNNRWAGFQKWWGGLLGGRQNGTPSLDAAARPGAIPTTPRLGKKNIDAMVNDFLTAWLVEGDVVASMGYVSERAYACLARDSDNPSDFDRGLAPFQLMVNLKSARDALGPRASLDKAVAGAPLAMPALRAFKQPHDAQFVIYSVPDDVAAAFDCESQLILGDPTKVKRSYGKYFGATFTVDGRRGDPIALLWTREQGYWKIVSWKVGADSASTPPPAPVPDATITRIRAEPGLVQAARGFLESWLVKKNYDAAFAFVSPKAYACYDLERDPANPASTSVEDAGRKLRSGLEVAGATLGASGSLEAVLSAPEPIHPAVRVMDHSLARVFSLSSVPNALADAAECAARAAQAPVPEPVPLEYGAGFSMNIRFKTRGGDAPVLRMLWRKENGSWRITSYAVERP